MVSVGLFVRLEAKPGKEREVAAFLEQGVQMANQEATTLLWFALRLGPSTFAIFDAFADESGRQTHLDGPIAKALMANAPNLLAAPPCPASPAARSMTARVTSGPSSAWPSASVRTASICCSAREVFSRKPLTPAARASKR